MKIFVMLGLALAALTGLSAQQVSEKQDLTLFDISFFDPWLDYRVVEGVDARIRQVFINLGRFNVIGLTYRLDAVDVDDFLARVREAKEAETYIPIQFRTGEALFTEADYNKLVNSFILVIPQINSFTEEWQNDYTVVNVETSFTIIDARTMVAIREIVIETEGSHRSYSEARRDALNAILPRLEFEIRTIPQFQIRTGVIEVKPFEVILELGRNMGIRLGDEFVIQNITQVAGFESVEEVGLVIIKDVQEKFSRGVVIHGNPQLGDPAQELPRFGVDIVPYLTIGQRTLLEGRTLPAAQITTQVFNLGFKGILTRGFFDFRPIVAFEYTQADLGFLGFFVLPFNVWVGGEYTLYLGRFTLNPGFALGGTGLYFTRGHGGRDPFAFSHFGARVDMNASLLFGNDLKIGGTLGGRFMIGVFPGWGVPWLDAFLGTYYMWNLGLEVTFKL